MTEHPHSAVFAVFRDVEDEIHNLPHCLAALAMVGRGGMLEERGLNAIESRGVYELALMLSDQAFKIEKALEQAWALLGNRR